MSVQENQFSLREGKPGASIFQARSNHAEGKQLNLHVHGLIFNAS